MFTIDADYNITMPNAPVLREDAINFATQQEFAAATASWTLSQYVALWNSFAGVPPLGNLRPVSKFMDRNTAVKRIWKALQEFEASLPVEFTAPPVEATITTEVQEEMPKKAAPTKKAKAAKAPRKATGGSERLATVAAPAAAKAPREGSRKETILALIGRNHGATLGEIMAATGWQAHSVRGFIATLGTKHGCKISSTKNAAGERVYEGS